MNGYFAFIEYADDLERHRTRAQRDSSCANGASDGDLCNLKIMKKACSRQDAVGDSVRMECPVSCGTCESTALWVNSSAIRRSTTATVRENRPTNDWFVQKAASGAYAEKYKIYNRLKLFTAPGFAGKPDTDTGNRQRRSGGRCEEGSNYDSI